jgi:hypothetical protein
MGCVLIAFEFFKSQFNYDTFFSLCQQVLETSIDAYFLLLSDCSRTKELVFLWFFNAHRRHILFSRINAVNRPKFNVVFT